MNTMKNEQVAMNDVPKKPNQTKPSQKPTNQTNKNQQEVSLVCIVNLC